MALSALESEEESPSRQKTLYLDYKLQSLKTQKLALQITTCRH